MKCPSCGHDGVPEEARLCPECKKEIPDVSQPLPGISVVQDVEEIEGAANVIGVKVDELKAIFEAGSIVNQQHIVNVTMELGPAFLDAFLKTLAVQPGVDQVPIRNLGSQPLPQNVSDQIEEITAAQKEVAARGVPASPQALYSLGRLAASRRQYGEAVDYFRQATQADPEYSDAYEAIVWLQQSRATDDIQAGDDGAAIGKLADARTAAMHTDPLSPQALTLRGYIAKTLAQIAEARGNPSEQQAYYEEAARFFSHVAQLDPDNPAAHNGLGNVEYARGNIDQAIDAYSRAIALAPSYTAAYHDLALAFEGKMRAEPDHGGAWCKKALQAWREAYRVAPGDPAFSEHSILLIGQRILWLEGRCDATE